MMKNLYDFALEAAAIAAYESHLRRHSYINGSNPGYFEEWCELPQSERARWRRKIRKLDEE